MGKRGDRQAQRVTDKLLYDAAVAERLARETADLGTPSRVEFLRERLAEEYDEAKRAVDIAARHLVILETVRHAVEEAQITLDDVDADSPAVWLADAVLGAFVVAYQEHEAFQPGWMSD